MLGDHRPTATIPVKDLEKAKRFYSETLGLKQVDGEDEEGVIYETGGSRLFVYRSEYAGTNKATAATWTVGEDVDGVVQTLKDRGVRFEHYDDLPETKREGDVHLAGDTKVAWFKDPDGNIHSVVNR